MRTGIFRSTLAEAERKKQVNKQTKAETKERWGKQANWETARDINTNIDDG